MSIGSPLSTPNNPPASPRAVRAEVSKSGDGIVHWGGKRYSVKFYALDLNGNRGSLLTGAEEKARHIESIVQELEKVGPTTFTPKEVQKLSLDFDATAKSTTPKTAPEWHLTKVIYSTAQAKDQELKLDPAVLEKIEKTTSPAFKELGEFFSKAKPVAQPTAAPPAPAPKPAAPTPNPDLIETGGGGNCGISSILHQLDPTIELPVDDESIRKFRNELADFVKENAAPLARNMGGMLVVLEDRLSGVEQDLAEKKRLEEGLAESKIVINSCSNEQLIKVYADLIIREMKIDIDHIALHFCVSFLRDRQIVVLRGDPPHYNFFPLFPPGEPFAKEKAIFLYHESTFIEGRQVYGHYKSVNRESPNLEPAIKRWRENSLVQFFKEVEAAKAESEEKRLEDPLKLLKTQYPEGYKALQECLPVLKSEPLDLVVFLTEKMPDLEVVQSKIRS